MATTLGVAQSVLDSTNKGLSVPDQECSTVIVDDYEGFEHRVGLVVPEAIVCGRLIKAIWTKIDHR